MSDRWGRMLPEPEAAALLGEYGIAYPKHSYARNADEAGVALAYEGIVRSVREHAPDAAIPGMLVCQQAPPGLEVIVGGLQDVMFGPALMFGLGGIFAEVLQDVTFRVVPIERVDAQEMLQEIRGYPLLEGTRGHEDYDVEALVDLLLAVSRMMAERTEIQELDLNPVRVYRRGLIALDARILLAGNG